MPIGGGGSRTHLHLGIALDDAGAHPAAWRVPGAAEGLTGAERLVRLARTAERGLLDFVSLDDSFDPPPRRDRRDCGCASTRCWRWPGWRRPRAPSAWCRPSPRPTPSRSTSPRTWRRSTSSPAAAPAGGWRCPPPPRRPAGSGARRPSPRVSSTRRPATPSRWSAGCGTAGRTTPSSATWPPAATSIGTSCTTSTSRGASSTSAGPRSRPARRRRSRSSWSTPPAPPRSSSPPGGPTSPWWSPLTRRRPRAQRDHLRTGAARAGRDPDTLAVLVTARIGEPRLRAELDRLAAAIPLPAEQPGLDLVGPPAQVADVLEAWFVDGAADGFLLRPDVLPATLDWFVDEVVGLAAGPRSLPRPATRGSRCATASGSSAPPTATTNREGADMTASPPASRSTWRRTSRGSTARPCGATPRRAARPTSPPSSTWPARPSGASSTSSSSPRASACASSGAASSTSTWWAGRTR